MVGYILRVSPSTDGVFLGGLTGGESALPLSGSTVVWPFEEMDRHALLLGGTDRDRAETSMRIAHEVASKTDAQVFYLSAGGDLAAGERFAALMREAGRGVRVFPAEPFDAWRGGDWRYIDNRLRAVFPREAPWDPQDDADQVALDIACNQPQGPPRSSAELLERLLSDPLFEVDPTPLTRAQREHAHRLYATFFERAGSRFDGDWAWEDADTAYVRLGPLAPGGDTAATTRLLLTDFLQYLAERKQEEEGRFCLAIVEGFEAFKFFLDDPPLLWQASHGRGGLVLACDSPAWLDPDAQRADLYNRLWLVLAFAMGDTQALSPLVADRFDLSQIPRLPAGTAWAIKDGLAAEVAIDEAPHPSSS